MKLIKAMATVAGLTGVSRILGFARDVMTAAILGAGPVADAFIVALKLPNFFRRITAEGAFSVSFVPMYSKKLAQDGQAEADAFASKAFAVMLAILTPFVILAMIGMPWVIYAIAPGFEPGEERYTLAVEMTRVTFPYLLLMSLTALLGGILNARDKFVPFAAAPIVFNLSLIAFLYFGSSLLKTPGHALSWGLFAAGILQFLGLMYCVKREKIAIRLQLPKFDADIKKLFKLMGPGVIGAGVMHINLFMDVVIASMLPEGSISYLYYADRLNQLPLGMVGIAVGTALLPMLSKALGGGDEGEARNLFNRALEICLLLALPAGAALLTIAEPLMKVLFERGAFDAEDARLTAQVLMGYAIGVPAYIASKVFSTAYYAKHDTASPVKIAIICAVLNIVMALSFIPFLGVAGIALGTGIAGWVQFALLFRGLKTMPAASFDARFRRSAPRILLAACVMSASLLLLSYNISDFYDGNAFEKSLALVALVACGLISYAVVILATGAISFQDIKKLLLRKKRLS